MTSRTKTRIEPTLPAIRRGLLVASFVMLGSLAASSQNERRAPEQPQRTQPQPVQPLVTPGKPGQTQQHLSQWIDAHRNLPLAQQQQALDHEPGFTMLPPAQQQNLHNRLTQLNGMSPERRQQVIERTEAMERLAPVQRQQVRDAYAQLGSMPEDRRRAVARAFNYIRALPADQRQNYMATPQFRTTYNDSERMTLINLLNAPYLPPAGPPPPSYPR